jgi:hypothetical protein
MERRWRRFECGEGIADEEAGEAGEIAIGRPEFADAVSTHKGGDSGVVNHGAGDIGLGGEQGQVFEITRALAEQAEGGALHPIGNLGEGVSQRRGRLVYPRVGDDGDELVQVVPSDRPGRSALGEAAKAFGGWAVMRRIPADGVDEDLGVDGGHSPGAG